MAKLHLLEGPVGAGKSTFAKSLAEQEQTIHIALDEWFARLFSPDRPDGEWIPWYVERKSRLLELIWSHSQEILASGTNVILELGLIQRAGRLAFYRRAIDAGVDLQVHVLDAPRELRRERVKRRNTEKGETFSMVVPDQVFEMASDLWEAPDDAELKDFPVTLVSTA
jgi:predicted kinase